MKSTKDPQAADIKKWRIQMKIYRFFVGVLALVAYVCANAQYPDRPIRIIVPFAQGGGTDTSARLVGKALAQTLGQEIVFENMPNSEGEAAALETARAKADGYTLFVGSATAMSYVPAVRKVQPYDPLRDFTPIAPFYIASFFLFANPQVPSNSLRDLIDFARSNPGRLRIGIGTGTATLATAELLAGSQTQMTSVTYKGEAPTAADLIAGKVDLAFATPAVGLARVKEGKLKALVTMLPKRSALLADVPTLAESGLPAMDILPWGAFFGPAGLPPEVLSRLRGALREVLARPEIREQMEALGYPLLMISHQELEATMKQQLDVWRRAVESGRLVRN